MSYQDGVGHERKGKREEGPGGKKREAYEPRGEERHL